MGVLLNGKEIFESIEGIPLITRFKTKELS